MLILTLTAKCSSVSPFGASTFLSHHTPSAPTCPYCPSYENIMSETGIKYRMNRSIQVEDAFGVLKNDYDFQRFLLRGKTKIKLEILFICFPYVILIFHSCISVFLFLSSLQKPHALSLFHAFYKLLLVDFKLYMLSVTAICLALHCIIQFNICSLQI